MQVVSESPKDGCQYTFELKDRMIRDKELDGQTEIPLKPAADNQLRKRDDSETDGRTDELEKLTSEMLQGLSCFLCLMSHFDCYINVVYRILK